MNIQNLTTESYGGNGGDFFLMSEIKSIQIFSGKYVDAIVINGFKHGGDGGQPSPMLNLVSDEIIVAINVRSGKYIDYLEFRTSKRNVISGGGDGGILNSLQGSVVALGGRSGKYLDHLYVLGDF